MKILYATGSLLFHSSSSRWKKSFIKDEMKEEAHLWQDSGLFPQSIWHHSQTEAILPAFGEYPRYLPQYCWATCTFLHWMKLRSRYNHWFLCVIPPALNLWRRYKLLLCLNGWSQHFLFSDTQPHLCSLDLGAEFSDWRVRPSHLQELLILTFRRPKKTDHSVKSLTKYLQSCVNRFKVCNECYLCHA